MIYSLIMRPYLRRKVKCVNWFRAVAFRLNTRGGRELGAETIAALRPSETPSWAIIDLEGSRAFVVFKTFHPKIKGEGRQDEPTVGAFTSTALYDPLPRKRIYFLVFFKNAGIWISFSLLRL